MIVVLIVSNFYRTMKENTDLHIKSKINSPAICQLIIIGIALLVSIVCFAYEIYQFMLKCKGKRSKKVIHAYNFTNDSMTEFTTNEK